MELLTPPTDNLYKFIAVGSLAMAAFFFYSAYTNTARFRRRLLASLRRNIGFMEFISAISPVLPPLRQFDRTDPSTVAKAKERVGQPSNGLDLDLTLDLMEFGWRRLPVAPFEMTTYFDREDVTTYFTGIHQVSDYEKFRTEMTLTRFQEMMRPEQEANHKGYLWVLNLIERNRLINTEIATLRSDTQLAMTWFRLAVALSLVAFGFWYWTFQRHQDAIVKLDRKAAELRLTNAASEGKVKPVKSAN